MEVSIFILHFKLWQNAPTNLMFSFTASMTLLSDPPPGLQSTSFRLALSGFIFTLSQREVQHLNLCYLQCSATVSRTHNPAVSPLFPFALPNALLSHIPPDLATLPKMCPCRSLHQFSNAVLVRSQISILFFICCHHHFPRDVSAELRMKYCLLKACHHQS